MNETADSDQRCRSRISISDIVNHDEETITKTAIAESESSSDGEVVCTELSSLFPPGTFVAVSSTYYCFNIGEVLKFENQPSELAMTGVVRVRWYWTAYTSNTTRHSPTLASLLSSTYFPEKCDYRNDPHEVVSNVGIMEVLVSFTKLRKDHRIPVSVRALIRMAISMRLDKLQKN